MQKVVRAAALVLLVFVTGCPKRVRAPNEVLESSAAQANDPNATARTLAFAGYHALLVTGDVAAARQRFDAAIGKDAADPWALYGQLLLSRRDAHPERGLIIALDLCDRAPTHPLCATAARYALDMTGTSSALDDLIVQRATAALSKGAVGDAAILLRSAIATVLSSRGDLDGQSKWLAELGMPQRWSLVGPLAPYSILSFDEKTEPEQSGALAEKVKGAFGEMPVRAIDVPTGRLSLAGEESDLADGFVLAVDADVKEPGTYVVRSVTSAAHKLYLDGTMLFERRSFERPESTVSTKAVELAPGKHRVLVKLMKDDRAGDISVTLARADGRPSSITFSPAKGAPPSWAGAQLSENTAAVYPDAADYAAALSDEAGDELANFVAVRDGLGRDRDGARRLLEGLPKELSSSMVLSLRADANLADRTVPAKVARGRAARDLETALDKDPKDVEALLARANLALDDGRFLDASEYAQQARGAFTPVGFQVPLLLARVQLGLGVDSQADLNAQEALQLQPGLCEALSLRYDLARRRDAVEQSDKLLGEQERCPGQDARRAEHARVRGDLEGQARAYQAQVLKDPNHVQNRISLVNAFVSQKKWDAAIGELKALSAVWPRNVTVLKKLGDVDELAGKTKDALAAREQALLIDGSDLPLRRQVERAKTGKELLDDLAISTKTALAAYETARGEEDATSAYILDAAAVRAYPDGSQVDRIHIIQKALDQSGVSDIAEVSIPAGAAVLQLRTLKADGTTLEPETFEHKETISLPGVQVGDYIEYEFLLAHPSRGPADPGFVSASFYFQIANQPNNWSTYVVAAPKGTGMSVEAHNTTAPQPKIEGNEEVFRHEERRVPPYIPEPDGPPSGTEFLPLVTVGAGETGQDGMVTGYADDSLDRAAITFEVEQFARLSVADKKGEDAVKALYAAVMKRLSGRDTGLQNSAASSLAQDRGSRLMLLKAALKAVGITSRLVAVRTFAADPAPFKFPNESLLPYVCLRVDLPEKQIWLDPLIRFAPYGELPEQAANGREAYLFPEPGLPLEHVKTPPVAESPKGKLVKLTLKLDPDGTLSGSGEETYQGFEAAQLAEALDSIPPDQRSQALQQALSRYFGGADLSNLKVVSEKEVGAPLIVSYDFRAPRFARVENDKLVLQPLTFPAQLGRRYVQIGSRKTPLYIESTEENHTVVSLKLPDGFTMKDVTPEVQTKGPAGMYLRREKLEGNVYSVDELVKVEMARIQPKEYDAFSTFAGEVDLVQTRELLVEKK
ncbi:MAG: DUF3857 domain-containing protein [Myxococcaceae bacterium]